jgi:hypothetical protein
MIQLRKHQHRLQLGVSYTYPSIPYPVVQQGRIYFEAEVQLLLFFAMDLFNGPFLEFTGRYRRTGADGKSREEEGEHAGRRCVVI